jgi:chromosome partitioning protein
MPNTRIVAVANHKGGTGKTTTAVSLGACLAERGRRVLLIDLDPQRNASSWLGFNDEDGGSYAMLAEGSPLDKEIRQTSIAGLAIVPATRRLARAEQLLAGELGAETLLRRRIAAQDLTPWHYLLVDTAPALGLLTINALAAAREVLVPVEAHVLALSGVMQIEDTVALVRERLNPELRVSNFVLCRFDPRTRHSGEVRDSLFRRFPDRVLSTVIRENVRIAEAPSFSAPISVYAPRSTGAADYRALAAEIIAAETH